MFPQAVLVALLFVASTANEQRPSLFPGYRIKEVKFIGGVAGATSVHFAGQWKPENAFKPNLSVNHGWHTGVPGGLPVMIWYDFKAASFRPAEVSFQPGQEGLKTQRAPTSYQLVGSNDAVCNDEATWTVLCEDLSDRAWRDHWEVRYCKVKVDMSEKFRCLGIRVLSNHGGPTDGWTNLRNIRMWERVASRGNNEFRIVKEIGEIP